VVDSLPTELQRDLLEIRGLDLRTEMLVQSLNDRINKVVTHAADLEDHGPSSVRQINEDFTKALAMADEKVQLAVKAYEAIDQHKKRLDAEISRYETTLATKVDNDGASSNGGGGSSSSKKSSHKKKGHAPVGKISANTKADKKSKKQRAEEDEDQPTDADGNEPTYCLCSRVSFGE